LLTWHRASTSTRWRHFAFGAMLS